MTKHPFPIPARAALAALAFGLAGAAQAANLVPMFKHEPPRVTTRKPVLQFTPRLTIVGANAVLQHNCSGPRPIFLAHVTLQNLGGPMAAHGAYVSVSDTNPGVYQGKSLRLASAGISLPAIGSKASAVVTVPVSALAPYAGEVGVKRLTVHVVRSYSASKSFVPPPDYVFRAVVPRGFCARRAQ